MDPRFFDRHGPVSLAELVALTGAQLHEGVDPAHLLLDIAPLDRAASNQLSFLDNPHYLDAFRTSRAGACFVKPKFAPHAPEGMILLLSDDPYRAYALAAQRFYPFPNAATSIHATAIIDPTAQLGAGVAIGPYAVIGAGVILGEEVEIGAHAVIEKGVEIGAHTSVGPHACISHALIGSHTTIYRHVCIGQDGFGFALGRGGHVKVPQLGRVIIGNHVDIGAGACIDRGAGPDTTIGDGAKIDNLVQIGHNVQIGRGAVIVAQVGIAGSSKIGDGAVLAGQVGVAGHITIGAGARVAAKSGIISDIPAGASYGGIPAVPIRDWHRQSVLLSNLIKPKRASHD